MTYPAPKWLFHYHSGAVNPEPCIALSLPSDPNIRKGAWNELRIKNGEKKRWTKLKNRNQNILHTQLRINSFSFSLTYCRHEVDDGCHLMTIVDDSQVSSNVVAGKSRLGPGNWKCLKEVVTSSSHWYERKSASTWKLKYKLSNVMVQGKDAGCWSSR